MRPTRRGALAMAGALAAAPALAHGYKRRDLDIRHPWTFEQEAARPDAQVGMTLRNNGKQTERLLRVETRDADSAEIVAPGGVVEIAPGSSVDLHPKGPHILLKGVRKKLVAYDNLFATLIFARAGRVRIEIVVETPPGA